MRWRYILPGGRSPFGGHGRHKRKPLRQQFDFGPGRNAATRLTYLSVAAFYVVLLLVVRLVTHA
jgi:hypothetical protein